MLSEDGECSLCRQSWLDGTGISRSVLLQRLTAEHPSPVTVNRLTHEHELRDILDRRWAARPIDLVRDRGATTLVLEDPGGEPLERRLREPIATPQFLKFAIGLASALRQVHHHGLVHKDLKPAHILVDETSGIAWLTGFGLASRLRRERQEPRPPEFILGTLAYMAPEQTGRMNRSIDSRSDLYALGTIFYQMLTGVLPFTASDPMEWIHCHIARPPLPPHERMTNVPLPISRIVMKLLAKMAEDRYQTAGGVERDLQRCLTEWQNEGHIETFLPGETDTSDRLLIPEKLYGRAREIETLLSIFQRMVAGNRAELVLVSGYSGIGKSAVVNELHKALVPPRGLFASGKFDQYKRDIPYATLAQALQGLVRSLLGKSDAELNNWHEAFAEALGSLGSLIVGLVPELKVIIGEQLPVPELSPQDAQARFHLAFRRFIGVFARREHPLALFLDDLQWLDLATLDLLEDLLRQPNLQYLMLVGAYRDNEVDSTHPLMRKLHAIRQSEGPVHEITLAPLTPTDLEALFADALSCRTARVAELARAVHQRTGGNPFFAIQFLSALVDEKLLMFDNARAEWSWDLNSIHTKSFTDNVVDHMAGKLNRLPIKTQETLKELASLGSEADFGTLAIIHGSSEEQLHRDLWDALLLEFIARSQHSYRFVHDRIQEAAYSMIPVNLRAKAHLEIGRLLVARTPSGGQKHAIFDIVNQLNRGAALITSRDEAERLAEFNLMAGKRARAATAYVSAAQYFHAGAALAADDWWERRHGLAFALDFHRAECEYLIGDLAAADKRLTRLAARAMDTVERAAVVGLCIDLYTTLDQIDRVIGAFLDYLRHLGIEWSPHPIDTEADLEYRRISSQLAGRAIADLIDLPLMSDPASLATLNVLTKIYPTAMLTDRNLLSMAVCRAVNLSLEQGNTDASCVAYVYFGGVAGARFADYDTGFEFGQLAFGLVEQRGLNRFRARTYHWHAQFVLPWRFHPKDCRELIRRAFDAAIETGDLPVAAYSLDYLNTNSLAAGERLDQAQRQAEAGLAFVKTRRFGHQIDIHATQLGLIKNLRGLTYKFGSLDDGEYSEALVEQHFTPHPAVYWILKLQARFHARDYASALAAAEKARPKLWAVGAMFEAAEYHYYAALSHAASCVPTFPKHQDRLPSQPTDFQRHFQALVAHCTQLEAWAEYCPETFENRAALVRAEIARIEGRELDAERLYERAISSAHAADLVQHEAIASEFAGQFYLARGFERIANACFRDARYFYSRWGADGKVRQLDELYPHLLAPKGSYLTSFIGSSLQDLDTASVVKASQALSSEIVLPKLLERLMTITIQNAGAERGLLILPSGGDYVIRAEAKANGSEIEVVLREEQVTHVSCPESLVRYVVRTQESVILGDASKPNLFSGDAYLRDRNSKSIFCVPLVKQRQLVGILLLENSLISHAFTPAGIAVLEMMAAQAAISLENTRLYGELQERETKVRRLIDSNIIGILIGNPDGCVQEANQAFLDIVGYDQMDLAAGRLRRTELTPAEWRDRDERALFEMRTSGTTQPFEKEYFRKDGSRVPVLVGGAKLDQRGDEVVIFAVDLTERKRAEAELAHANRVATMGQLTASIAHEVNQPLAALLTNAETTVRWLERQPPNLERARPLINRIIDDGRRAADILSRIRDFSKKAPARRENVDINEAILGIVGLARASISDSDVLMKIDLADNLPPIFGDGIQLQQVVLNLITNAIEAMSETTDAAPRELQISTNYIEAANVLVAVGDTGPGLPQANSERIFEAFYTTKPTGLGMGLSICRSIIEAHGGRLWATPNKPRGAIVCFSLSVAEKPSHLNSPPV
ncbi:MULTISPECIES: AAA family ATPase [unclassified Bradyrhizobium]|uniref:trifunctional serine/threonine-protein kinase/ATP-binding protein/sensor histidine kinase n=1 Tax=unclassified Bradyrhizobium TaxID=2631580 RepID=UPI001FFA2367